MKKQAIYYIIFLTFLMTQFNNCSPADISSSNITSLSSGDTNQNDEVKDPQTSQPFYKQDFETNMDGIMAHNSAARIESTGYNGQFSLRSNLSPNIKDVLTLNYGSLSVTDMSNIDINGQTDSEVYMRFWFKFDQSVWDPIKATDEVYAKIYLSKVSPAESAEGSSFVITLIGGTDGKLKVMDNYDGTNNTGLWAGWDQTELAWHDGSSNVTKNFYAKTQKHFGSDGAWHLFELHINYGVRFHSAQIKIDGAVARNTPNTNTEGYFKLPPQFKLHQFRLFQTEESFVINADYAPTGQSPAGVQIDDIELWSQRP